MLEKKISKNIASCAGMIFQRSARTYAAIPAEHRRWIGLDDVVQEGYIAAIEAERKFEPQGAKYSTFLFNALTFHFNHEFTGRLRREKRTTSIAELDATVDGEDRHRELTEQNETMFPISDLNSVDAFINLCRTLSPSAIVWFVGSIMANSYSWERVVPMNGGRYDGWTKEVKNAVEMQGVHRQEIDYVMRSQRAQKMALISLAQDSSIGLGTEMDARVLECISCQGRFALAAIRAGRYVVETMTCLACYRRMQEADPTESCFGKPKTAAHEGYSETDIECSLHCKDRNVCRQFTIERTLMKDKKKKTAAEEPETKTIAAVAEEEDATPKKGKKAAAPAPPAPKASKKKIQLEEDVEVEDVDEDEDDDEEEEAPTKKAVAKASKNGKAAKAAKEEKPSKAAKAEKTEKAAKADSNGDEYPAPKDIVRWPHKTGSWMQYCFQQAYRGIKAAELEQETDDQGRKWAIFLKVLRGGKSGMKRPTHTWRLDETGGRLKIHDVKYLGGAE